MFGSKRTLLSLEACAWSAGLLCLAALLVFRVEAMRATHAAEHLANAHSALAAGAVARTQIASTHDASSGGQQTASPDLATFEGVIGQLEIPALKMRVPILNDYDPDSLRRGVGRMKGTAVPGGLGNLVLAGHRDTYFRPLRGIRQGMLMRVLTGDGTFVYAVDSTSIVTPDDVDVLDIGNRPEMTLITCYPFNYFGAAPKRFIVHTHLVSLTGEAR